MLVIYSAKDTIYILFIFCFSSVTGNRRGLMSQRLLCYGQDMQNHEQITSKETQIRACPRVCQILLGKSCALPTSKKICQVKKEFISNNLT
jgi:hypothetical protein